MHTGSRFAAWRKLAKRTTIDVGAELGVAPSYVSHIEAGRMRPGLRVAAAIERLTRGAPGGAIRAEDWLAHEAEREPRRARTTGPKKRRRAPARVRSGDAATA